MKRIVWHAISLATCACALYWFFTMIVAGIADATHEPSTLWHPAWAATCASAWFTVVAQVAWQRAAAAPCSSCTMLRAKLGKANEALATLKELP